MPTPPAIKPQRDRVRSIFCLTAGTPPKNLPFSKDVKKTIISIDFTGGHPHKQLTTDAKSNLIEITLSRASHSEQYFVPPRDFCGGKGKKSRSGLRAKKNATRPLCRRTQWFLARPPDVSCGGGLSDRPPSWPVRP